jgi:hypothetical protein
MAEKSQPFRKVLVWQTAHNAGKLRRAIPKRAKSNKLKFYNITLGYINGLERDRT